MARKRSSFFPRIQSVLKLGLLPCLSVAIALAVVLLPVRITTVASGIPIPDPLLQQSQSLYDRAEYDRAVSLLQQAVASYRQQGDELGAAIALGNLALAYQQLGQWQSAEQAIADSLQLLPDELTASAPILAQILAVRGRWELKQGKTQTALATWQETTTLYRQLKDEAGIIRSQLNQAQALTSLGRYFQAEKTLTKALQQLPPEDSPLKATALHSLGNVYRSLGNLKRSRQVLEQSLSMATATQSPTGEVYLSLGNTARAERQPQAALNFYRQAVENANSTATRLQAQLNQLDLLELQAAVQLAKQIESQLESLPPSHSSVSARINLAENWQRLQQKTTTEIVTKPKLISILTAAQQQAEQLGDNSALAYALGNLAQVYATNGELSKAIALTQQALYQGQAVNDPSLTYRWQLQLGRLQQQAGDSSEAIAAYTAAVNNLQALRQNLVALNTQVQFDFRQRVEPVYRELVDLLLRSQPSQADLVLARQTIESLQLVELENFLRQACLEPRSEIDELVENDTTAVIYPIVLEDRLEIILKLPQTPLSHFTTVVNKDEFDTTVTTLRTDLLDVTKTASVQQQSQQLYTWLIEPLSTALADNQIDTLVFVLDGSLRNIPMSVLYDRAGGQYLIEQYALAIAPGLQLVQTPPLTPSKLNVLTAGISQSVTVAGRDFTSLANVKQELEQIQSEVADSKQLIDRDFTLKNLQQQLERSNFPVVHLATHGEFSSNPEQTFLLTWNQLLTTQDLANLLRYNTDAENAIELLVMSACETATGDPLAALGLAGIAARAGVSSTVASLWFADDQYSFQVMNIFYRELSQGTTKAKALQKAQIAVLKAEPRPYLWSPFILLGNWL